MTFSDEDLKRWKNIGFVTGTLADLVARLEASERKNKADDAYADFDCSHESEDRCKCGLIQLDLIRECEAADKAWRESKGL